jgi:uncharacterized protein (TIGR01777 family)
MWDPESGRIDNHQLEGFAAVIHLAGENIASGRWTKARKERIRDSRVRGSRVLAEALAKLVRPPQHLLCASAIGYYGDRGEELLTENSQPGTGFLAEVCRDWEEAAQPARAKGIRTTHLRFGVVLSAAGGALAKMLTPFRIGVGGRIGSGHQFMSWITIDDVAAAVRHVLENDTFQGPINVVAPSPVTNLQFTKALGRVLSRPTIFPMPALMARLAFGQMANELLLASQRVQPERLQGSGYAFRHTDLEAALRHLLGR